MKKLLLIVLFCTLIFSVKAEEQKDSLRDPMDFRFAAGMNLFIFNTLLPATKLGDFAENLDWKKSELFFRFYVNRHVCVTSNFGYVTKFKYHRKYYQQETKGGYLQLGVAKQFNKEESVSSILGYNFGLSKYRVTYYDSMQKDYWNDAHDVISTTVKNKTFHELYYAQKLIITDNHTGSIFVELVGKLRFFPSKSNFVENKEFIPGYGVYFSNFPLYPAIGVNVGMDF